MNTGNNKATNNIIIRLWSKHYYHEETRKFKLRYKGKVTEVKGGETTMFNTPAQMLAAIEKLNKNCEKRRRENNESRREA